MESEQDAPLADIKEYWNHYINDIEVCKNPVGTLEFFDELETYRYRKLAYLQDYVGFHRFKGKKVLEVGCGPGVDLLQFARAGADPWAIDLTPRAVELARENLALHGFGPKRSQVCEGNAEALTFADESFDAVYSNGVLHHTANTEKAIAEIRRVLKPGGEAIVMLYNRWSWFYALAKLSGINIEHPDKDAPIIRTYSVRQVRTLFREFRGKVDIQTHRFPKQTFKYHGISAKLHNHVFVPLFNSVPRWAVKPLGWHILVRARKET
jgi:ubiquinone/menaquinone biosynthesis C-methylase UbiE